MKVKIDRTIFQTIKPNSASCIGRSFCCKYFELFGLVTWCSWPESWVLDSRARETSGLWFQRKLKIKNLVAKTCNQCIFQNLILLLREKKTADFIAVQDFKIPIANEAIGFHCNSRWVDLFNWKTVKKFQNHQFQKSCSRQTKDIWRLPPGNR